MFLLRPLKIFHFVKEGRNHLQNSGLFLLFCKDIIKSHLEHFTRLSVVKVMLRSFDSGNVDGAFGRLNLGVYTKTCVLNLLKQYFYIDKSGLILGGPFLIQEEHEESLLLLYKQAV